MDNSLSINEKLNLILEQLTKLQSDVDFLKNAVSGNAEAEENADLKKAIEFVIEQKSAAASQIQRQFGFTYNKSARIIAELESSGVIGRVNGTSQRVILVNRVEEALAKLGYK